MVINNNNNNLLIIKFSWNIWNIKLFENVWNCLKMLKTTGNSDKVLYLEKMCPKSYIL